MLFQNFCCCGAKIEKIPFLERWKIIYLRRFRKIKI